MCVCVLLMFSIYTYLKCLRILVRCIGQNVFVCFGIQWYLNFKVDISFFFCLFIFFAPWFSVEINVSCLHRLLHYYISLLCNSGNSTYSLLFDYLYGEQVRRISLVEVMEEEGKGYRIDGRVAIICGDIRQYADDRKVRNREST